VNRSRAYKMHHNVGHPKEVVTISESDSVAAAAIKMCKNRIGCLIVTDSQGKLIGILTERDIVKQAVVSPADVERTTTAEIMMTQVVSCPPGTPASKAREIMAANEIRHLPIVEGEVVVGMFSVRDLLQQQLIEDRAAAEQVAALSTCLTSIDLNEIANLVTKEVPKIFQAKNCVLRIYRDRPPTGNAMLISSNGCACPEDELNCTDDVDGFSDQCGFNNHSVPHVCEKQGAQRPRVVIPLTIRGSDEASSGDSKPFFGCLCICALDAAAAANKELITYKAKLVREILNAHLTNARLYQEVRLTSLTDPLTHVGSRKLLEDRLEAQCALAKRYNRSFTVAIIDLDNFKTINDVLGHAVGDDALRELADCMRNQQRASDVLSRYGGDEFVILMPETKAQAASALLERLRANVQKIRIAEAENVSMTVSGGVAEWLPGRDDSPSEVIRRADVALYEAKSAGRNCVKIWNENMSKLLSASDLEITQIKKLKRRIAGLSEQSERMFLQSIWGLVQALEAKDAYAKAHSENVMFYAIGIGEAMSIGPRQIEIIRRAAMIHDIGKIGIPDAILSKPDVLTRRERSVVEQHPLIAVRILSKMEFLEQEMAIVRHHHEKWNGQGYPDGLSNSSIPLGARVITVADTFDALTSSRPYHPSRCVAEAMEILVDSSGYDFDPRAVEGMTCWVEKISQKLGKKVEELTPNDLLDSQKRCEDGSKVPFVADAVTSSSATS
jgi:diguanylate cyclase (GGDEF)-like protein